MTRCVGLLVAAATLLSAQATTQLNLMPWPAKVELGQGSLAIGSTIRISITGYLEPRLQNAVRRIGEIATPGSPATLVVECEHASEPVQRLGEDESYHLEITQRD
jgi:hexosaminidase